MFRDRLRRWRSAVSARLVDDWRCAWRWASVRLAVVGGALTALLANAPGLAREIFDQLPAEVRTTLPVWAPVLITALPILVRVLKQRGGRDA
jgi:hypothetical protein